MNTVHSMFHKLIEFIEKSYWGFLSANDSAVAAALRKKTCKTSCGIDTGVYIKNKQNFKAGTGCNLYHGVYILNTQGTFTLGNSSHLGAFCFVNVCYGKVTIGEHVAIGPGTKILAYSNDYARGEKVTRTKITEDIIINNNVFIGADCILLPGTTIKDNVVVGAGSLVKGELDANSVYAGIPCKKIKSGWFA